MQENNELPTYSPEEVEQLIAMTEELQTENEQQRTELNELRQQKQTVLSENQKLKDELHSALLDLKKVEEQYKETRRRLNSLVHGQQPSSLTQQQSSELRTALSKIQTLLSDNRKLQSQVQQLTAKNESLQSSDEQLKHAEELKKQSEQREKQAKERERKATITADRAKQEASAAIAAANKRETEAKNAKSAAEQTKKKEKELIQAEAERQNRWFRMEWAGLLTLVTVYGIFATAFTVGKSERCMNDLAAAGKAIGSFFVGAYKVISTLAGGAASLGEGIPQPVVATIVSYLLGILTVAVCIGAPLVGLYFGGKALVECYIEHCWDWITPIVLLGCFAVLVWFAELMPLNIVLLLILSHAAYIVVRWYIDGYNKARGL